MARIPDSIGKYKVTSEVARGGMGAVYTAKHPTLDRTVIIKKLTLRGNSAVRERFRREASIMMDFRNEYIVDVLDHFREGPSYYIVQEYVDGFSLSELLYRERYLPERIALLIFQDCCNALKYAHDRRVIHRDIKPGNLLIARSGEVKLVDFGVARAEDVDERVLTREGMTLGTPSYMAPEQFNDTRGVDRRADIYSAGVVLYEMVTGKRPFPGSITPETMRLIQHGRYRRPRRLNPAVSRFTGRLIRHCMQSNRKRRYSDLSSVLKRLHRRLRTADVASERAEIASYLSGNWRPARSRSPLRRMIAAVIVLVVLAAGAAACYGARTGLLYEYLKPDRYGDLQLVVRVPRSAVPSAPEAQNVTADLSIFGGADPATVDRQTNFFATSIRWIVRSFGAPAPDRSLSLVRSDTLSTQETAVFESGLLHLPAGSYRLTIRSPGQSVSRDLFVPSAAALSPAARPGKPSGSNRTVVSLPAVAPRALSVSVTVVSAVTGREITGRSSVELLTGHGWVSYPAGLSGSLRAGADYRFRIGHVGYYTAEYRVRAAATELQLSIAAVLVPDAGEIRLASEVGGLQLTLDGSRRYRAWGPHPAEQELPRTGGRPVLLSLAPGSYKLVLSSGGVRAERQVTVESGYRLQLSLASGGAGRNLRIESAGYAPIPAAATD